MSLEVTERLGYLGGPEEEGFLPMTTCSCPMAAATRPASGAAARPGRDGASCARPCARAHRGRCTRRAVGVRFGGLIGLAGTAVAERGGTFQPSREARADGVPGSRRRRGPPERCAGRRRIRRAVTSTAEPLLPEREVRHDFGDGMRSGGDAAIGVVPRQPV